MDFPIYRKYKGIDVWFRIENASSFTEFKRFSGQLTQTHIQAKIYPDFQFINDMIQCHEGRWEEVNEADFNRFTTA